MVKLKEKIKKLIKVVDKLYNKVVLTECEEHVQELLQKMDQILEKEYNIKISRKKTKVVVCITKKKVINVTLGGKKLKQARELCYLSSTITEGGRSRREIIKRLAKLRERFTVQKSFDFQNSEP